MALIDNFPYVTEAKYIALAAAIIFSVWYVYDLKLTISNQKTTIAEQAASIATQNEAITDAASARETLESKLQVVVEKNKKLQSILDDMVTDVEGRQAAKTCSEAMRFLNATNSRVLDIWNTK
jgi:hypothetical protein